MKTVLVALTALGVLQALAPVTLFSLFFLTGFRLTENWDGPMFVAAWGFLLGVPACAAPAAWIARAQHRGYYRANITLLSIWLACVVVSLLVHN